MRRFATMLLVAALASACKAIPAEYQGVFVDADRKVRLVIAARSARLELDGRTVKASAVDATFETLNKARPGLFVETISSGAIGQVFWLEPNRATVREAGGLRYYEGSVFFLSSDQRSGTPVSELLLTHAPQGGVMLDTESRRWQVGSTEKFTEYRLTRVSSPR